MKQLLLTLGVCVLFVLIAHAISWLFSADIGETAGFMALGGMSSMMSADFFRKD